MRPTPEGTPSGYHDPSGQHYIPLKVQLTGPGEKTQVKLVTPEGRIEIKLDADGLPYPAEGVELRGGESVNVRIYGAVASNALDDASIVATTGVTGAAECGHEDLTVIWVGSKTVRGTDSQGQPLTPKNAVTFSGWRSFLHDVVGKFIVDLRDNTTGQRSAWIDAQVEMQYVPSPNIALTDKGIVWDIRREAQGVTWLGQDGQTTVTKYTGNKRGQWVPDPVQWFAKDVVQHADGFQWACNTLFELDVPYQQLPRDGLTAGVQYWSEQRTKFRSWTEVQIGGKWYVCSAYLPWKVMLHALFNHATKKWEWDTGFSNRADWGHGALGPESNTSDKWQPDRTTK
jgi:hypothetical protein